MEAKAGAFMAPASKADPIFRGSKHFSRHTHGIGSTPKQTRSSGGQNLFCPHTTRGLLTPKQTRSSGGQNAPCASSCSFSFLSKADPIFRGSKRRTKRLGLDDELQSRPDLQGVKTCAST